MLLEFFLRLNFLINPVFEDINKNGMSITLIL